MPDGNRGEQMSYDEWTKRYEAGKAAPGIARERSAKLKKRKGAMWRLAEMALGRHYTRTTT